MRAAYQHSKPEERLRDDPLKRRIDVTPLEVQRRDVFVRVRIAGIRKGQPDIEEIEDDENDRGTILGCGREISGKCGPAEDDEEKPQVSADDLVIDADNRLTVSPLAEDEN